MNQATVHCALLYVSDSQINAQSGHLIMNQTESDNSTQRHDYFAIIFMHRLISPH